MTHQILRGTSKVALAVALGIWLWPTLATPLETVNLTVAGDDPALEALIKDASLLWARREAKNAPSAEVFADARAEYGRLIETLYNQGYFSAVITIRLDGREAASIAPLNAPRQINVATVTVTPGPRFTFSQARVQPLAPATKLPKDFAPGETATTGVIREAVELGVEGWRKVGHARAGVAQQDLVADHRASTMAARVDLEPGPALRFGDLTIQGNVKIRTNRVGIIAGLKEGDSFSSDKLERASERLRRTGIFSAVSFEESEAITPPDRLPVTLTVTEAKPRRYSFGAEVSSQEGVSMMGTWLHRNMLGGGERFTIGFEIDNITPSLSGTDYSLDLSLVRPATITPDTTAGVSFEAAHLNADDFTLNVGEVGLNFTHFFSNQLSADAGLTYAYVQGSDAIGSFLYRTVNLPIGLTWDRRDQPNDATKLFYIDAEVKPFLGFGSTENGVRLTFDTRGYYSLDEASRYVVAARIQGGSILGASILGTPREQLFYSGGGGTVRGQPYQSLGITVTTPGGTVQTGGTTFLGGSLEGRLRINDTFGAVAFLDAGTIFDGGLSAAQTHAGAGVGLRYQTGFGPLRLDVARPVSGSTGDGIQVYVGLGQAF
jgi:translocation and assembly module TamA